MVRRGGVPDVLMAKYQKSHKCSDWESFAAAAVTHQVLMSHVNVGKEQRTMNTLSGQSVRAGTRLVGLFKKKKYKKFKNGYMC